MERLTRRELWWGSQGETDKAVNYKVDEERRCVTHEGSVDFLIVDKLAEYEDLEEQGKLLKLPCAVGDTVYAYCSVFGILEYEVDCIVIDKNITFQCSSFSEPIGDYSSECLDEIDPDISDFGKTVFLTRQEAEDKLAEMEGKK